MLPDNLRVFLRLCVIIAAIIVLLPFQLLIVYLHLPGKQLIPMLFHKIILWAIGAKVDVSGPIPKAGTLIVSNHVSWLDICVIGSVLPVSFIAKADISGWPLLGLLAKLQSTLFIKRDRRSDTANQSNAMQERLLKGDRLLLFPEGTTGDGTIVFPFKSSLFSSAELSETDRPIPIQPLSLVFSQLGGIPMSRCLRIKYAWIGDVGLLPNMLHILKSYSFTVKLTFHAPVNIVEAGGRKNLSTLTHRIVQNGVACTTAGALSQGEADNVEAAVLEVSAKPLA
ncbi:hypothetical protein IMCC14465_08130 [alpha proteobacterium IMCC14465]|uniref:Phospholipid/glycerol acyltransferase domain-containing protein n=1 Tax=alpha proteobacterium IMCC14465 TaxID=1220535 RepID=J9DVK7_9PROT|nr:hypothetical protein IMCC14465_08130 [alpha proteobacterium IMCC14465]